MGSAALGRGGGGLGFHGLSPAFGVRFDTRPGGGVTRATLGWVGNAHHSGPELVCLGDEHIDRRANTKSNHLVRACLGPHHIERLGADTAATAGDGDPDRTHFVSQGSRICIR
jgi:hypothetical protein